VYELADLLEADFAIPARHDGTDRAAGRHATEFRLHLLRNTHSLDQPAHVNAARATRVTDGLGGEQRAFQSLG
jgi:hypothetical protein